MMILHMCLQAILALFHVFGDARFGFDQMFHRCFLFYDLLTYSCYFLCVLYMLSLFLFYYCYICFKYENALTYILHAPYTHSSSFLFSSTSFLCYLFFFQTCIIYNHFFSSLVLFICVCSAPFHSILSFIVLNPTPFNISVYKLLKFLDCIQRI